MNTKQMYLKRMRQYSDNAEKLERRSGMYSTIRLVTFAAGTFFTVLAFMYLSNVHGFISMGVFFVLFLFLVAKHQKVIDETLKYRTLAEINKRCVARMEGTWTEFEDKGEEYADPNHMYSKDLDVFGHGSLFQWINTTNTFFGRERLRRLLEFPEKEAGQIRKRQNAVKELSKKIDFCQSLQCEGMMAQNASKNPDKLLDFCEDGTKLFRNKLAEQLFYILPELTIVFLVICWLDSSVSLYIPFFLLGVQAVINIVLHGRVSSILGPVSRYKNEIKVFYKMIELIEKKEFEDEYLIELKSRLFDKKKPASEQIKDLEKIVEATDIGKGYIVEILLNFFLFWNIHCVFALERWKAKAGKAIRIWLETIGDFEALASLALVAQMNPEWAFPEISDRKVCFNAVDMGHPLINEGKRVCNSINMDNKICIVTGSNMSGKTTLLRTVGVNLLLAYAGTAVCAKKMTCSVMDICTSMRVVDDLNEGISTFYAELLRIKMIIDHSRMKKPMIFLIDEVFRGTNSLDRVTGARNVLLNLDKDWVIGMISTHDFELCNLEKGREGRIVNYHFAETYTNNEIKFDYILRRGQCKKSNARYLMKMVGIELLDE
ncbi:MAG TPA: DNA mismatch repair protein MutS [Hungateiclostridium thermocellum]|jgi:DNA mismatch repair ATPase MutS|uniref:DNA mismatch repair protein MutS domain protein n=2 Tax=Acetivibrio thermocellus TaxID=1515 RepID=A3DC07_ACET2|nr:MutS family DNA mismatch repair protein [Acetivibrio thermocellus]ABN51486.1 DNA mismatch repair protein MutS domain protein [Acetivibrio thermocellus ATCC 27405]ADU75029.1 DNA mismatch repair protein MutS domain protein [Acetivibrio thermocellus DSM 1313]ALX08997.1 DNA mismatch repair protein MutS domain protein [Acetivibrio thermocellus AD2]ANV76747.1 DNA mismatch repair protein MutS domain protein [Acetivibrio thermocellus DSM 2360]EIC05005.1 DNA mismatch repair protein MutS domain prote